MSALIPPVPTLDIDDVANQPSGGATVTGTAANPGTAVITSNDTSAEAPVKVTGVVELAVATQNTVVEITSGANAVIIGTAVDNAGNQQDMSGLVVNAAEDSTSSDIVNLQGANVGDAKVDLDIDLGLLGGEEGTTIADEAPGGGEGVEVDTYVHTAGGIDEIEGTGGADFIRAGAGNDIVDASGGNDIVRVGSGADEVTLGNGEDVLYVTADQLDGSANVIRDWDNDDDQVQIDANIQGDVNVSVDGATLSIEFTNPDTGVTNTTTFVSIGGDEPVEDDVEFV